MNLILRRLNHELIVLNYYIRLQAKINYNIDMFIKTGDQRYFLMMIDLLWRKNKIDE